MSPRPGAGRPEWAAGLLRWPSALERQIALRYLRGRSVNRLASLSTWIAIGGVMVGVAALIVILGVTNGLRDDLRERILVANPHLRILTYGNSLRMDGWKPALDAARATPGVVAAAPEVLTKSLIINSAEYPAAVDIIGIDPDTARGSVTDLAQHVVKGDLSFRATQDSVDGAIVLGHRLAARLSAFQGDIVSLVSPTAAKVNRALGLQMPKFWRFEVTGIFDTGMYQYDDGFAVMALPTAQRFAGLGEAVTGIQIRLANPWQAPGIGRALEKKLGYPYRAFDWQSQNASLFSALKLEKLAMGLIICLIMIVAAFNIIGTLTMVVAEKTREIGILQAMGLPAPSVGRVFLAQGSIVGLVGTSVGMVLGLGVSLLIDRSGWIRIDPAVYFIDHLPVHVEALDVMVVVVISLAVTVLATIHPSRAAARLTPVEAIRHE